MEEGSTEETFEVENQESVLSQKPMERSTSRKMEESTMSAASEKPSEMGTEIIH